MESGSKKSMPSGEMITAERAMALQQAFIATRLLEEEYFDDVVKAFRTKDKKLFEEVCIKAKVPTDLKEHLWLMSPAAEERGPW